MANIDRLAANESKSACAGEYEQDELNGGARKGQELGLNQSLYQQCYEGTERLIKIPLIPADYGLGGYIALPATDKLVKTYMKTYQSFGMTANTDEDGNIRRGTGFFVDDDGLFASVKHLVEPLRSDVSVQTADLRRHKFSIVAEDPKNDLVLLMVEPLEKDEKFKPLTLAASSALKTGDDIVFVGEGVAKNPYLPAKPMMSTGKFGGVISDSDVGLSERLDYVDPNRSMMRTNARTIDGNSGGAMFRVDANEVDEEVRSITDYGSMTAETDGIPIERLNELIAKYRATHPKSK